MTLNCAIFVQIAQINWLKVECSTFYYSFKWYIGRIYPSESDEEAKMLKCPVTIDDTKRLLKQFTIQDIKWILLCSKIEQVFNILFLLVGVGYNTPKNQFCLESDLLQILNSDVNQFAQKDNRQEIDFWIKLSMTMIKHIA